MYQYESEPFISTTISEVVRRAYRHLKENDDQHKFYAEFIDYSYTDDVFRIRFSKVEQFAVGYPWERVRIEIRQHSQNDRTLMKRLQQQTEWMTLSDGERIVNVARLVERLCHEPWEDKTTASRLSEQY